MNWAEGFTLYVVAGKGEKEPFIADPDLSDEERLTSADDRRRDPGDVEGRALRAHPARLLDCGVRPDRAPPLPAFNLNTDKAWIFEVSGLPHARSPHAPDLVPDGQRLHERQDLEAAS